MIEAAKTVNPALLATIDQDLTEKLRAHIEKLKGERDKSKIEKVLQMVEQLDPDYIKYVPQQEQQRLTALLSNVDHLYDESAVQKLINACGTFDPALVQVQDNNLKLQGIMSNLDRVGQEKQAKVLGDFEQQFPGVILELAPEEKGKLSNLICRLDPLKHQKEISFLVSEFAQLSPAFVKFASGLVASDLLE